MKTISKNNLIIKREIEIPRGGEVKIANGDEELCIIHNKSGKIILEVKSHG